MEDANFKILMLGPLPPPVGGARVLFKSFVEELEKVPGVKLEVIQTWNPKSPLWEKGKQMSQVFIQMSRKISSVDMIAFWASETGMLVFGPVVLVLSFFNRKPWMLRRFGRGYSVPFAEMNVIRRFFTKLVFRCANLVLLETQQAVRYYQEHLPEAEVAWHGNYRNMKCPQVFSKDHCRRFVYLGKVRRKKGILEIIQAAGRFKESDIVVDVYGPLGDDFSEKVFQNNQNVNYKGIVRPDRVPEILSDYDALLLPTYFAREGYPGVILEAYGAGLPVIVSDWPTIREIVDENSGIFISPASVDELYRAMRKLVENSERYQKLSMGALDRRDKYSIAKGVQRFVSCCQAVVDQAAGIEKS